MNSFRPVGWNVSAAKSAWGRVPEDVDASALRIKRCNTLSTARSISKSGAMRAKRVLKGRRAHAGE